MNIDTLQPGRELDAIVAEKVMGWGSGLIEMAREGKLDPYPDPEWPGDTCMPGPPAFSTDPAAMMKVVEKMTQRKCTFDITGGWDGDSDMGWVVDITDFGNAVEGVAGSARKYTGEGKTLMLAFARAALRAVKRGGVL